MKSTVLAAAALLVAMAIQIVKAVLEIFRRPVRAGGGPYA